MDKIKVSFLKDFLKESSGNEIIDILGQKLEIRKHLTLDEKIEIVDGLCNILWDEDKGAFDYPSLKTLKPFLVAKYYIQNIKLPTITIGENKETDIKSLYDIFMNTNIMDLCINIIKKDFEDLQDLLDCKIKFLEKEYESKINIKDNLGKLLNKFATINTNEIKEYQNFIDKIKKDENLKGLLDILSK